MAETENVLDKMVGKATQIRWYLSRNLSEDFGKTWRQEVQAGGLRNPSNEGAKCMGGAAQRLGTVMWMH